MRQGHGDSVEEGLGADEAVVGEHVGAVGEMLAGAEPDLDMKRAVFSEQARGGDLAFRRHFDLREKPLQQVLLRRLPDGALSFVYLLHPDPWPKARHAKRRMINDGPLDLIAAKLKPGGELRLGTDDPTYCRWSMMIMNRRRDFEWLAQRPGDFLEPSGGWIETRYGAKSRREGRRPYYLRYRRTG